ncbi:DEAD/DEAH box helicase family protein [Lentzea sp. BCCO 10_0061]|uniref:DEAD/DEAH box helicase family protein n=1 Tax=Lentzea sokolovensis TaxID=3095429 RepID=A0ABU4UQ35_9PSEU|nr:DEAD/DEAH box helicase family protein [Lentzea sp. BCCO 10_0061]MDX8141534.1 DEAD/DEAH box helicase family protein [Lentzea sp. BCCO 10_0061]
MTELQSNLWSFENIRFTLYESATTPRWRNPQRGALAALLAHWSLPRTTPALISLPTGTGKSAIALAAPFLMSAKRVLAVVPSIELRQQLSSAFCDLSLLQRIGAIDGGAPRVLELKARVQDWTDIDQYEVVVASPGTISPVHYIDSPPPADLFDLIIVDEAHHSTAPTWRAILEHFDQAKSVLLTATPRRLDGQRLPGEHVYHYPLRQALEEHIFKPIKPVIVDQAHWGTRDETDQAVLEAMVELLRTDEHKTSTLLVRAASRQRAAQLAEVYRAAGVDIEVLHSGLSAARQRQITSDLRSGRLRAVSVVGMLIEGFDLPSLRLLAYHDKHRSLPATAQLIGRLARVDDRYPQPSVLVTAKDIDVFPELQGVVRNLYGEDQDWATVLPGIIDDEIQNHRENREYARQFGDAPPDLALDAVQPLRRAVIRELRPRIDTTPRAFEDGVIHEDLRVGKALRGKLILYSGLNPAGTTLMVITESVERPAWHNAPGLDAPRYQLHLVSRRDATRTDRPDLLFVNVEDNGLGRDLLDLIDVRKRSDLADPGTLQAAFDSLTRQSVSSVGLRNNYGGSTGTTSYRMFAGKGVDRGLREVDTAYGSLGHAMIQVADDEGTFTAGVATAKGKYWETRYSALLRYEAFLDELAERYWFPPGAQTGQLLPQVNRGTRLTAWPIELPIAVELDPALIGMGWTIEDVGPLDALDFEADMVQPGRDRLVLRALIASEDTRRVVWTGELDLTAEATAVGDDLLVSRGYGVAVSLSDLLTDRPPTIFFGNGDTVHGSVIVNSRSTTRPLPNMEYSSLSWTGVDLEAETRKKAAENGKGRSIHEELETYLNGQPRRGRHRWIVHNDGGGEFADYVVIEIDGTAVSVGLWHAKYAGGKKASVRVIDLQEVVAQAIKSRRWITDPGFWTELGKRLTGASKPKATVVHGRISQLLVICGAADRADHLSFARSRPLVQGTVAIVQPGLSYKKHRAQLTAEKLSAVQVRDLLTVFHDSVLQVARPVMLCSS